MNRKTLFGLLIMLGFVALLFFSFGEQVQGYSNFADAGSSGNETHVVGTWVKDHHFQYDRERNVFSFHMADEDGNVRQVQYLNPKPANFEDAEQVVVEGHMVGEVFVAQEILVKCPSKYNELRTPETAASAAS